MEYSRKKATGKKFNCKSACLVLKQVFTNPLVLLTFCGLILRFVRRCCCSAIRRTYQGRFAFTSFVMLFTFVHVLLSHLALLLQYVNHRGICRLALWAPADSQTWYADWVEPILTVVSSAFTGCALFSLGLLIVGKVCASTTPHVIL